VDEVPLTPQTQTLAADRYERFATSLQGRLARTYPRADPQQVADALVGAILLLSRQFQRYDSNRGSLASFLFRIARRNLERLLLAEKRRLEREKKKSHLAVTGEASVGQSVGERLGDRELAARLRDEIAQTPEERRALDLWLAGETERLVIAAALQLTGSREQQEAQVETLLARLRQRIHRCRQRYQREDTVP
jgi:hypothetical protein